MNVNATVFLAEILSLMMLINCIVWQKGMTMKKLLLMILRVTIGIKDGEQE